MSEIFNKMTVIDGQTVETPGAKYDDFSIKFGLEKKKKKQHQPLEFTAAANHWW